VARGGACGPTIPSSTASSSPTTRIRRRGRARRSPSRSGLARLRAIDVAGKCDFAPGTTPASTSIRSTTTPSSAPRRSPRHPTAPDWVLQLDTDEVIADLAEFRLMPRGGRRARRHRARVPVALPLHPHAVGPVPRDVVATLGDHRQLPRPGRRRGGHRPAPCPPGRHQPVPGGISRRTTPTRGIRRTRSCSASSGLGPGSCTTYWVRSEEHMRRKAGWSGHADTYSEPARCEPGGGARGIRCSPPSPRRSSRWTPVPPDHAAGERRYWVGES
jgi:hypothetical protein